MREVPGRRLTGDVMISRIRGPVLAITLVTLAACSDRTAGDDTVAGGPAGGSTPAVATTPDTEAPAVSRTDIEELFPDVVEATATQDDDGTWTVWATLSSPYDTPERYADAWRVIGPAGEVYAVRELTHDHADEQPFTRSQSGVAIPEGVSVITVQGRDQISGWGGAIVEVGLTR